MPGSNVVLRSAKIKCSSSDLGAGDGFLESPGRSVLLLAFFSRQKVEAERHMATWRIALPSYFDVVSIWPIIHHTRIGRARSILAGTYSLRLIL